MFDESVGSYEQEIKFVIGIAGTGKSTELAKRYNSKVLVMTPTHAACGVLKKKGINNAVTIHSVLGLVPQLNQNVRKGGKFHVLSKVGDVDLAHITDVFVDEYSMISTDIIDILLEAIPPHCKVTIFGDSAQLPPVDGQPIDPDNYSDDIMPLLKQYRAEAPEVVETFMRFASYIANPTPSANLQLNAKIEHGSLDAFNPETDRALSFTNNKAVQMNNEIAHNMQLPERIVVGEDIIIGSQYSQFIPYDSTTHLILFPKASVGKGEWKALEEIIEGGAKAMQDIEKWSTDLEDYEMRCIEVHGLTMKLHVDFDYFNTNKRLKEQVERNQERVRTYHQLGDSVNLASWCKDNRGAKYVKERGEAWSEYIAHQSYVFDVRRPHATTVHKAQGREFHTVFIAQEDMKRAIKGGYYAMYARLMYVSLSRAIKRVVIVP